jgi:hypothetical protein
MHLLRSLRPFHTPKRWLCEFINGERQVGSIDAPECRSRVIILSTLDSLDDQETPSDPTCSLQAVLLHLG